MSSSPLDGRGEARHCSNQRARRRARRQRGTPSGGSWSVVAESPTVPHERTRRGGLMRLVLVANAHEHGSSRLVGSDAGFGGAFSGGAALGETTARSSDRSSAGAGAGSRIPSACLHDERMTRNSSRRSRRPTGSRGARARRRRRRRARLAGLPWRRARRAGGGTTAREQVARVRAGRAPSTRPRRIGRRRRGDLTGAEAARGRRDRREVERARHGDGPTRSRLRCFSISEARRGAQAAPRSARSRRGASRPRPSSSVLASPRSPSRRRSWLGSRRDRSRSGDGLAALGRSPSPTRFACSPPAIVQLMLEDRPNWA